MLQFHALENLKKITKNLYLTGEEKYVSIVKHNVHPPGLGIALVEQFGECVHACAQCVVKNVFLQKSWHEEARS